MNPITKTERTNSIRHIGTAGWIGSWNRMNRFQRMLHQEVEW